MFASATLGAHIKKIGSFPAHAADDALTLLRIHSGTLYNARAACKMVCEVSERKILPC